MTETQKRHHPHHQKKIPSRALAGGGDSDCLRLFNSSAEPTTSSSLLSTCQLWKSQSHDDSGANFPHESFTTATLTLDEDDWDQSMNSTTTTDDAIMTMIPTETESSTTARSWGESSIHERTGLISSSPFIQKERLNLNSLHSSLPFLTTSLAGEEAESTDEHGSSTLAAGATAPPTRSWRAESSRSTAAAPPPAFRRARTSVAVSLSPRRVGIQTLTSKPLPLMKEEEEGGGYSDGDGSIEFKDLLTTSADEKEVTETRTTSLYTHPIKQQYPWKQQQQQQQRNTPDFQSSLPLLSMEKDNAATNPLPPPAFRRAYVATKKSNLPHKTPLIDDAEDTTKVSLDVQDATTTIAVKVEKTTPMSMSPSLGNGETASSRSNRMGPNEPAPMSPPAKTRLAYVSASIEPPPAFRRATTSPSPVTAKWKVTSSSSPASASTTKPMSLAMIPMVDLMEDHGTSISSIPAYCGEAAGDSKLQPGIQYAPKDQTPSKLHDQVAVEMETPPNAMNDSLSIPIPSTTTTTDQGQDEMSGSRYMTTMAVPSSPSMSPRTRLAYIAASTMPPPAFRRATTSPTTVGYTSNTKKKMASPVTPVKPMSPMAVPTIDLNDDSSEASLDFNDVVMENTVTVPATAPQPLSDLQEQPKGKEEKATASVTPTTNHRGRSPASNTMTAFHMSMPNLTRTLSRSPPSPVSSPARRLRCRSPPRIQKLESPKPLIQDIDDDDDTKTFSNVKAVMQARAQRQAKLLSPSKCITATKKKILPREIERERLLANNIDVSAELSGDISSSSDEEASNKGEEEEEDKPFRFTVSKQEIQRRVTQNTSLSKSDHVKSKKPAVKHDDNAKSLLSKSEHKPSSIKNLAGENGSDDKRIPQSDGKTSGKIEPADKNSNDTRSSLSISEHKPSSKQKTEIQKEIGNSLSKSEHNPKTKIIKVKVKKAAGDALDSELNNSSNWCLMPPVDLQAKAVAEMRKQQQAIADAASPDLVKKVRPKLQSREQSRKNLLSRIQAFDKPAKKGEDDEDKNDLYSRMSQSTTNFDFGL